MRFVFISSMADYPWGGSEYLWSRAALRLREEGHQVGAAVKWRSQTPKQVAHLAEKGIEIYLQERGYASLPARSWRKLKDKFGFPHPDRDLRWMLAQKPDLVCVSGGGNTDGLPFLEKCSNNGLPFASVIQANSESTMWPADVVADRLIRVYSNARRAFFVSHQNRFLFETQLGVRLTNAEVIRNPINVGRDAKPPWPDESSGLKLACIARYEPGAKGQDILFHVLAADKWKSRPVTLSLYGAGPMEKGLRRLATMLGLDDRVRILGHVDDIEKVWAEHHALVLASRIEGLPLVLVEALMCGRPAVITALAGDGEMVQEGVNGFIAPAPIAENVDSALERAWQRRADWRQLGEASRQRVEKLVPADPVGEFCARLKSCVHPSGAGT